MKELWKAIPEYEGKYEVSNYGRIRSKTRLDKKGTKQKGKMIQQYLDVSGYFKVKLSNGIKRNSFMVHRLVAQSFLILPYKKYEVHHIDHDKTNNKVQNLMWVTRSENINYAIEAGVIKRKLDDNDVRFIRNNYKIGDKVFGVKALSERFGVSKNQIRLIIQNKSQSNVS